MLAHVMEIVEKDGNFDAVLLHVQINNDSAIKFYKRSGFDIVETKEQVCMQGCVPSSDAIGGSTGESRLG